MEYHSEPITFPISNPDQDGSSFVRVPVTGGSVSTLCATSRGSIRIEDSFILFPTSRSSSSSQATSSSLASYATAHGQLSSSASTSPIPADLTPLTNTNTSSGNGLSPFPSPLPHAPRSSRGRRRRRISATVHDLAREPEPSPLHKLQRKRRNALPPSCSRPPALPSAVLLSPLPREEASNIAAAAVGSDPLVVNPLRKLAGNVLGGGGAPLPRSASNPEYLGRRKGRLVGQSPSRATTTVAEKRVGVWAQVMAKGMTKTEGRKDGGRGGGRGGRWSRRTMMDVTRAEDWCGPFDGSRL